jgi:O-antigen ligase
MHGKFKIFKKDSTLRSLDGLMLPFLALFPLCLLSIRGWTNTFFALLVLGASIQLTRVPSAFSILKKQRATQWMAIAMASPLIAVIAGQFLRGQLQTTLMDGPSRPLLAIVLFTYLLYKPIDFVRLLEWCIPFALIILACFLWVHPYGFVNIPTERFGTDAIDPLTLGQYATLFGFICLFTFDAHKSDSAILNLLKLTGMVIAAWISVGTGSRSGWAAFPVLLLLWILFSPLKNNKKNIAWALLGLLVFSIAIYQLTPTVHDRISLAANEYMAYVSGTRLDSSTGLRISLAKVAGLLFLEHPFSGYGDRNYPALSSLQSIIPFYTGQLEEVFVRAGVHNEILQNALRSGIWGVIASILMFAVPAVIFYQGSHSRIPSQRTAGRVGLCYIVALFCFGLSTETFNLKYTISFYALMVSALAAQVLRPQSD